jgi:hypothetical protein
MKKLTLNEIKHAFSIMGEFLRDKKTVGEIPAYGGGVPERARLPELENAIRMGRP